MKNTFLKTFGTTTLAILMLAIFAQTPVSAQDSGKEELTPEDSSRTLSEWRGARALEGSWNVQVTIRNCQSGAAVATFAAMSTFMQGGTMQEFSTGSAPLMRGPGHGVWNHVFGQNFTYAFQFFRFNADGTYASLTRARRQVEMNTSGYSATATIEVFNPAGVLVATACATETATRFE